MVSVSVIMPIYNSESTLETTLNSIAVQSYLDLEVLMLNDCSTDRSGEIMDQYAKIDPRFKAIHLDRRFGAPAGPRNIGIEMAKGEWIAFLDSDDVWHKEKLERQLIAMKQTNTLFSSTAAVRFTYDADIDFPDLNFDEISIITFDMQLKRCLTPTSSVVVRKDIIEKVKFNENLTYKAREDLDCFLHCHEVLSKSVKIKGAMLAYRVHQGQISGNKIKMIKRHFHVLRNYEKLDGTVLGFRALWFTVTHFVLVLYPRLILKRL